ncbi:MAG: hypothetical protein EHM19_13770, partial [Candidatus Latescibacterota bacterium]
DYEKAFNDELTAYRGEEDIPVLPSVARILRERAWNRLVNSSIVEKRLEDASIPISDEEVVYAIRSNPPEFLRANEAFLTNGRFDYQKYRQAIDDPSVDWRWLESYVRSELPISHLKQRVAVAARVTEGELRELYVQSTETVDFSFVAFLPGDFEDVPTPVSPAEMQAYYDQHLEEFRVPERASLDFVAMPIAPSEEDRGYLRSRMQEIIQRLAEGTPFEDLARYHSEGPTAAQGGDIGTFRRGDLTPELEDVAFSLQPGQVSGVIETEDAFQLVQAVEKSGSGAGESVRLRQIFMKIESGGETVEKVRLAADALRQSAESAGLRQAASQAGVAVRSTGLFEEGSFVPGIGDFRGANLFAFTSPVGSVSDPIFNNDVYFVLSVASRDSSRVEAFEEATTRLREMTAREKRIRLAEQEANRLRGDAAGATLDALAKRAGREVRRADLVTRVGSVPTVGRDTKLILAAFSAPAGRLHGPIHTDFGSYYIRQEKVTPIDEQRYMNEKAYLIRSLLT